MIVSKNADTRGKTNPLNRSALDRKGIRRGRQVVLYQVSTGTAAAATIMSAPLDKDTHKPDRENGQLVRLRFEAPITTNIYSLYELGVVPDETGEYNDQQYLLDRNQYNNQQLREDGSELREPRDRS
ncbi:MAG: hypothetical protein JWO55_871 [Candidatus Saccharibacteria bacterium]|jgi:hypothetical protein|nr:hypothetical protein [Candidatus Saccharibacteria bacterium]